MKKYIICFAFVAVFQGCSKNSGDESITGEFGMSNEACLAIGGKLEGGHCLHEGEIDMKVICDAEGLEFSSALNACILGEEATRKMCKEKGLKYSEVHKGCVQK